MKIVFFGTSDFAAGVLSFLLNEGVDITAVVTRPDRAKGRSLQFLPPPVKELLLKQDSDIPIYQPEKASTEDFAKELSIYEADLFVVVAYGEIIKTNILNLPKIGCINIHASLLPKYRGAAPMQRALMDGVAATGITIIDMVLQMDAGDMLARAEVPVSANMTFGELEPLLLKAACQTLLKVFRDCEQKTVKRVQQDPKEVTFAPKIMPEETEIKWDKPAGVVHNLVRAFSPHPGAWCFIHIGPDKKRLKIKRTEVVPNLSGPPGSNLLLDKSQWVVACGEGALRIIEVQLEGKKSMRVHEFLQGVHEPITII